MDKNRGPDSERLRNTIVKTIGSGDDFPTSVLIWHVATDICYYAGDNRSTDSDKMKKHKQMSRELSHYIMYLVFKSGVMLTANSQHVHEKAHGEIGTILSGQGQQVTNLDEKAATMKLFQTKKKEEQHHQPTTTIDTKKHEEPAEDDNAAASFQQKLLQITQGLDSPQRAAKLSQSAQVLHSPVVPRACEVAQELSSINDDTGRWDLIASVCSASGGVSSRQRARGCSLWVAAVGINPTAAAAPAHLCSGESRDWGGESRSNRGDWGIRWPWHVVLLCSNLLELDNLGSSSSALRSSCSLSIEPRQQQLLALRWGKQRRRPFAGPATPFCFFFLQPIPAHPIPCGDLWIRKSTAGAASALELRAAAGT
nr:unnamed protein product [Digitaria exilis]